jgi:hypothetical protein
LLKKVKADNKSFITQNDNFRQKRDIESKEDLGTFSKFNSL